MKNIQSKFLNVCHWNLNEFTQFIKTVSCNIKMAIKHIPLVYQGYLKKKENIYNFKTGKFYVQKQKNK